MAKLQSGVMFAFVAFILLILSFILPWWGIHYESTSEYGSSSKNYSEYSFGVPLSGGILGYSAMGGPTIYGDNSVNFVFWITAILMILAIIFVGLMLFSFLYFGIEKSQSLSFPKTFGILAIIFCLLAPIIFMVSLPGAMKTDAQESATKSDRTYIEPKEDDPTKSFFGSGVNITEDSYSKQTRSARWGGDIGWILSFISLIFIGLGLSSAFSMSREMTYGRIPLKTQISQPPEQQYQQPQYTPPSQYQQPMQQPQVQPVKVRCGKCGNIIETTISQRPIEITCNNCGSRLLMR